MADDDFDIDIYGDTTIEQDEPLRKDGQEDITIDKANDQEHNPTTTQSEPEHDDTYTDIKTDSVKNNTVQEQQQIKSTDESGPGLLNIPKQAPQQQGVRRKEGSDDRPVDPGATTALLISDLHWWNTDDDIRGWMNQAQCEDELKDITFSEHKVNGKSKGQAYIEFDSQQAATAAKRKIDTFGEGQQFVKKHTVTYSNPTVNPFRTLPKDAPMRAGKEGQNNRSTGGNYNDRNGQNTGGNYGNNFRGRGSGYNSNRGNMNNMGGFNRNFSGPGMGGMNGGYQAPMNNFQGGSMNNQFGNFNRGGMMNNMRGGSGGMRGGRGGLANNMMGGMPMGGMPMGPMPAAMAAMAGPMNMGQMGGGLPGPGFTGMQPHFNPAFFQQNQAAGGDWQNPHGAKRPRPE